jgi:hypothetical protein
MTARARLHSSYGNFEFTDLLPLAGPATLVVQIPRRTRTKRGLLDRLARGLKLPSYFGHNWDALEECLRDLHWLPTAREVVIVHESLPLRGGSPAQRTYLAILNDVLSGDSQVKGTVRSSPRLRVQFPSHVRPWVQQALTM